MENKIAKVLLWGVSLSSFFIVIGLILSIIDGNLFYEQKNYNLNLFFLDLSNLKSKAFLMLGIFLLILTPIIRVIGMLIQYILEKDKIFIVISSIILIILFISLLLGTTHN